MSEPDRIAEFEMEIALYKQFNHYAIIKPMQYFENPHAIVFPLYQNGTLMNMIINAEKGKKSPNFTINLKAKVALGVASAMNYIHSMKIANRELNPTNIYLDNKFRPILTNLGHAKKEEDFQSTRPDEGNPFFTDPELSAGESREFFQGDIYSYGVLLYVLFNEKIELFPDIKNDFKLIGTLLKGNRPEFPENFPYPRVKDLIQECWKPIQDGAKRMSFEEILEIVSDKTIYGDELDSEDFIEYYIEELKYLSQTPNRDLIIDPLNQICQDGSPSALLFLTKLYKNGLIVKKDTKASRELLKMAAETGNNRAVEKYIKMKIGDQAHMKYVLKKPVPQELMDEINHYIDIASNNGSTTALTYRAKEFLLEERYKDAGPLLEDAVKKNDPHAIYELGLMILYGNYYQKDYSLGIRYLQRAANLGSKAAKVKLSKFK